MYQMPHALLYFLLYCQKTVSWGMFYFSFRSYYRMNMCIVFALYYRTSFRNPKLSDVNVTSSWQIGLSAMLLPVAGAWKSRVLDNFQWEHFHTKLFFWNLPNGLHVEMWKYICVTPLRHHHNGFVGLLIAFRGEKHNKI